MILLILFQITWSFEHIFVLLILDEVIFINNMLLFWNKHKQYQYSCDWLSADDIMDWIIFMFSSVNKLMFEENC